MARSPGTGMKQTRSARSTRFAVAAASGLGLLGSLALLSSPRDSGNGAGGASELRRPDGVAERAGGGPEPLERSVAVPTRGADASSGALAVAADPGSAVADPVAAAGVPHWLREAIDLEKDPEARVQVNRLSPGGDAAFDPRHLAVLQDIIEMNGLNEDTSADDYDDGDGTFAPLELGLQVWVDGRLVALSLGPDPYWSFGYEIHELPTSIGDLDRLEYLDVHGNALEALPEELGQLAELRELKAHQNALTALPDGFSRLSRLRGAYLGDNELAALPESIHHLSQLERLYLDGNRLSRLPDAIGDLPSLRTLGVRSMGAGDEAEARDAGLRFLPESLGSLAQLDDLYVSGNHLGCIGGPPAELLVEGSVVRVFGLSAQRCAR